MTDFEPERLALQAVIDDLRLKLEAQRRMFVAQEEHFAQHEKIGDHERGQMLLLGLPTEGVILGQTLINRYRDILDAARRVVRGVAGQHLFYYATKIKEAQNSVAKHMPGWEWWDSMT